MSGNCPLEKEERIEEEANKAGPGLLFAGLIWR